MDTLFAPGYDAHWGTINPTHRAMVARILRACPAGARILDAACGTGKYWSLMLAAGADVTGIDQSGGMLRRARAKFPGVPVQKVGLQEMTFNREFDGAVCIDAIENVFPDDWPIVLANLNRALKPGGLLYLTVELPEDDLAEVFAAAVGAGLPVVSGEYVKGGGYHYYPDLPQVRRWVQASGFSVSDHVTGDGYYHFLLQSATPDRISSAGPTCG
jgi:SAM-dependent methyltransferase